VFSNISRHEPTPHTPSFIVQLVPFLLSLLLLLDRFSFGFNLSVPIYFVRYQTRLSKSLHSRDTFFTHTHSSHPLHTMGGVGQAQLGRAGTWLHGQRACFPVHLSLVVDHDDPQYPLDLVQLRSTPSRDKTPHLTLLAPLNSPPFQYDITHFSCGYAN